jgi:aarF domain-containing kinase
MLLTAGRLLPKGLFLDRTIEVRHLSSSYLPLHEADGTLQVMSSELTDECSYTREASFLQRFASPSYLGEDPRFKIPWVWQGSSDTVLVMERVGGVGVGDVSSGIAEETSGMSPLKTQDRNDIAARIIELCLKELFEFRTMQTDPNWTNFLWNARTRQVSSQINLRNSIDLLTISLS